MYFVRRQRLIRPLKRNRTPIISLRLIVADFRSLIRKRIKTVSLYLRVSLEKA